MTKKKEDRFFIIRTEIDKPVQYGFMLVYDDTQMIVWCTTQETRNRELNGLKLAIENTNKINIISLGPIHIKEIHFDSSRIMSNVALIKRDVPDVKYGTYYQPSGYWYELLFFYGGTYINYGYKTPEIRDKSCAILKNLIEKTNPIKVIDLSWVEASKELHFE